MTIRLGDEVLLTARVGANGDALELRPAGPSYRVAGDGDAPAAFEAVGATGPVTLVLGRANGSPRKILLGTYARRYARYAPTRAAMLRPPSPSWEAGGAPEVSSTAVSSAP